MTDCGCMSGELLSRNNGVHRAGSPAGLCTGLPVAGAVAGGRAAQAGAVWRCGADHHGPHFARSQPAGVESAAAEPLRKRFSGTEHLGPAASAGAQPHHRADGHRVDHLLAGSSRRACNQPTHTRNPRLLFALSWRLFTRFIFHSGDQDRIKFGDIFIHCASFIFHAYPFYI